jgi:large subunit ribosomal protein L10
MSKQVKKMEIDALTHTFQGVRDFVLLAPDRIDSAMTYNIRKSLRDKKVKLHMVKNTLARKVLKENGVVIDDKYWSGTTLVAFGADSVKELGKAVDGVIKDIIKKNPKDESKLRVKTAVADGNPITLDQATKMPTRLEAIGEIISMMMGPAESIASALTSPGADLASQIASIADKKEEAAPEAAEAVSA